MTTTSTPASASWMGTVGPRWLSDVLGAAGVVDGAVAGVETEPLGVASAAGELARLSLTYEPAGAAGPATIIAKAPGSSEIRALTPEWWTVAHEGRRKRNDSGWSNA